MITVRHHDDRPARLGRAARCAAGFRVGRRRLPVRATRSKDSSALGEPEGAVRDFIDWTLSPTGQRIVAEVGYVPKEKQHGA